MERKNQGGALDRLYPKRRPLARVLMEAAKEQGATVEDVRAACEMVKAQMEDRVSQIFVAELMGEG